MICPITQKPCLVEACLSRPEHPGCINQIDNIVNFLISDTNPDGEIRIGGPKQEIKINSEKAYKLISTCVKSVNRTITFRQFVSRVSEKLTSYGYLVSGLADDIDNSENN